MWVFVHIVCYLVDSWQRMQNLHILTCLAEHVFLQDIHVLYSLVFHEIGEAFLLHTCHIENVCLGNDVLVEIGMFHIFYAVLFAIQFVFIWHGKLLWSYKVECRIEMTHCHDQRVYCTTVFEVADKKDIEVLECALCLVDRIEVKHAL